MIPLLADIPDAVQAQHILGQYLGVLGISFLICLIATPIMRRLALSQGIVDWPDKQRKTHTHPIPYLGGLAIFLGWLGGYVMCLFIAPHNAVDQGLSRVDIPLSILFGAVIITIIGLIDDVYGISPRVKVGGQLLAAAALAWDKVGIALVTDSFRVLGVSEPPFILCYILGTLLIAFLVVGACNSTNLLDGLDGLAAGVTAIAAIGFLFIALYVAMNLHGQAAIDSPITIVLCLALLGSLLGFLPYNFNPASIFMGDTGSLLLGYLSIATILMFARATVDPSGVPQGPFLVMAALMVFGLPITDTTLAIVRRKMRGQPLFSPDSQHLHHQLLRMGLRMNMGRNSAVKLAVLILYLVALLFGVMGCMMVYLRMRFVAILFVAVFGFIIIAAYKAGHREAQALHKQPTPPVPPAKPPTDA